MRKIIHALKYGKNNGGLGYSLTPGFADFYRSLGWAVDLIIPIPLSAQRLRQRGYNQVDLVARPLADFLGVRYTPQALEKIRHTDTQVGKTKSERKSNVLGAFRGSSALTQGKTVLILDDVATTGSTLQAASLALREAGAAQVFALTLARALPHHGFNIV
ncbi:MAG: ComF family protein [Anaerolineales bacterium]